MAGGCRGVSAGSWGAGGRFWLPIPGGCGSWLLVTEGSVFTPTPCRSRPIRSNQLPCSPGGTCPFDVCDALIFSGGEVVEF